MQIYAIPGFEEPFSCFSHLFSAPCFLIWGVYLIVRYRKRAGHLFSLLALVTATVFLLSISGVFHLLGEGSARAVMRQLDIAGIFALIAATATAVHMTVFSGLLRWIPVVGVWVVAVTGITLRTIFSDSLPLAAGTGIFLVMGWGGVITFTLLWRRFGFDFVKYLLAGGVAYSVGAVVLMLHKPSLIPGVVGPHELWHVAVLAGLGLHWLFVEACLERSVELEKLAASTNQNIKPT